MRGGRRSGRAWIVLAAAGLLVLAVAVVLRAREQGAQRAAWPLAEGTLSVSGLAARVEIRRGAAGLPHVEAASPSDAWFGLGFVHAQDRLAQMQWLVRLARGRTSEWIGPEGLEQDRFARTLDLGGVADAEAAGLRGPVRDALEAYARGVNAHVARVASGQVAPPVPLLRLGVEAEPWSPADSLAVLKLYAWGVSGAADAALVLDDLLARLGGAGARRFFPDAPGGDLPLPGDPPRMAAGRGLPGGLRFPASGARDPLRAAAGLAGRSVGSSAWVVGGAHTVNGLPMLAADLHYAPTAPPLLHLAHVRAAGLDAAGVSLPGVPGFWTGANRRIAWAGTAARASVSDLYTEVLHPDGEPLYHDGGGWAELGERLETIEVRGAAAEELRVRSTRHGPLVQDLLGSAHEALALDWTGLAGRGPSSVAALLGLAEARDASELLAALSRLSDPPLAVVYGDAAGAAGMQVAGWIPQRTLATELVPVPGRARWYDWEGPVPFERLPRTRLVGGRGWALAADNRLAAGPGARYGEWLWRSGARAARIEARLRAAVEQGPVDLPTVASLQVDVVEPRADAVIESALSLVGEDLEPQAREVADLLAGWSRESSAGSTGAAVYHVFLEELIEGLLAEPLGEDLLRRWRALPQVDPTRVILRILEEARSPAALEAPVAWAAPERVRAAVHRALGETWFGLSYRLGPSRARWQWGRLHPLFFRPFGPPAGSAVPGLGPIPFGGSGDTLNAGEHDPEDPFSVRVISALRFAADAGALDHALVGIAPGVSEHPGHAHFDDGLARWLEGRSRRLSTGAALLDAETHEHLVLEPEAGP